MKISQDNFISIVLIFFTIFVLSCNNCPDIKSDDYIENIDLFNKIIDEIETTKDGFISIKLIKEKLKTEENVIIKKLGLIKVEKIKGVVVFSFSFDSNDGIFDKKIDSKLKTNTSNKKCNHYLFYGLVKNKLDRVSHFENYSECRKDYMLVNDKWVYSSQIWNCND